MPDRVIILKRHVAWIRDQFVVFDPLTHARQDEHVYRCLLTETEGDYPMAELEVLNPENGLYGEDRKQWILIAFTVLRNGVVQTEEHFRGRIQEWPISANGQYVTLRFKAEPDDAVELREVVLEPLRFAPFYDTAFVGSADPVDDPAITLDARPALVHWDRVTLQPSVVSQIDAPDMYDMGALWARDSLDMTSKPQPPDVVSVRMRVQWRQPIRVLQPFVAFGQTLTPRSVEQDWPKEGASIGSGYTVITSDYGEGYYGSRVYSLPLPPFGEKRPEDLGRITPTPQEVVREYFFSAQLQVRIEYEIQRTEDLRVDIVWNGQASAPGRAGRRRMKRVDLNISSDGFGLGKPWRPNRDYRENSLVDYAGVLWTNPEEFTSGDSFADDQDYYDPDTQTAQPRWIRADPSQDIRFGREFAATDRGYQCVQHMALVGQRHLAQDRRHLETKVERPAGDTLDIRCASMGRLVGSAFPNGEVIGKIVSYSIEFANGKETATVNLASVPGTGEPAGVTDPGEVVIVPGPGERDIQGTYDPNKIYTPSLYAGVLEPYWWPAEYTWPPRVQEDPFGLYTYSGRFPMNYPFNPPGGFPAQRPAWWPSYDFNNDGTPDGYWFSWPPDEYTAFGWPFSPDASGGEGEGGGDGEEDGDVLQPSDESWDWLVLPDVSYSVWNPPTNLITSSIVYHGSNQDYILRNSNDGFWGGRDPDGNITDAPRHPNPFEAGYSPATYLPQMGTRVRLMCKDVTNLSARADYRMQVKWNGPRHITIDGKAPE